jgi:hypothetical protein
MKTRNNKILILAAAVIAFLCAVPLLWFTVTNVKLDGGAYKALVVCTGINGNLELFVKVPIWLLLVFSIFATGTTAANILEITSIPKVIPASILIFCGAFYLITYYPVIILHYTNVSFSIGPIVAIIATIIALAVTLSTKESVQNSL